MENKKSIFQTLNEINVNEHTETKNGLTYLAWAWAWSEVKKLYPNANYKIYETDEGCIYWTDGKTAWVKTGVIIEGLEHIEYLPVMDYNNRSIPLEKITSFDVNKAIQRSLTKAVARHGLGLYIYAGEDLPEGESEQKSEQKIELDPQLLARCKELGIELTNVAIYLKKEVKDLTDDNLKACIAQKEQSLKRIKK